MSQEHVYPYIPMLSFVVVLLSSLAMRFILHILVAASLRQAFTALRVPTTSSSSICSCFVRDAFYSLHNFDPAVYLAVRYKLTCLYIGIVAVSDVTSRTPLLVNLRWIIYLRTLYFRCIPGRISTTCV